MIVTYRTTAGPLVLMLAPEAVMDVGEWETGPRAAHADEMGDR